MGNGSARRKNLSDPTPHQARSENSITLARVATPTQDLRIGWTVVSTFRKWLDVIQREVTCALAIGAEFLFCKHRAP